MRRLLPSVLTVTTLGAASVLAWAPAADSADPKRAGIHVQLEATLARLASGLDGASGYLIRDLDSGETFAKDADAVFPAASTIKLPVFIELYKRAKEGTIDLSQPVRVDPGARVEGGGVLEKWAEPYPSLTARQLSVLMEAFISDVTRAAYDYFSRLAGSSEHGRRIER